jgi:DNA-damage-inducible protein D
MDSDNISQALDARKRTKKTGVEYWSAREIQTLLGYQSWQNFEKVIEKAKTACENAGGDPSNHFNEINKVIEAGKGAKLQRGDYWLSRYACYLVAMNGDPSKTEISFAQTYFAVQTRRQELNDQEIEAERRLEKRRLVSNHNRQLAGVAKQSGVRSDRFGIFQDKGYIGLYTMSAKAIKAKKRIPEKDNLLDYAGCEELAANDFRITQTARKLNQLGVRDEYIAGDIHEEIGARVRRTIVENGNPMPEDLPPEPHIKTLAKRKKNNKLNPQT